MILAIDVFCCVEVVLYDCFGRNCCGGGVGDSNGGWHCGDVKDAHGQGH